MTASVPTNAARRSAIPPKNQSDQRDSDPRGWIGLDLARFGAQRPSRALLPLLIMGLVVALGVAALRIDLIRTRYALAAAMDQENALIAKQHELIVRKRQLRDPVELAVLARARGFQPADTVRTLTDPMPVPSAASPSLALNSPRQVASVPAADDLDAAWEPRHKVDER